MKGSVMAKKKAAPKKSAAAKTSKKKNSKSPREKLGPINAPAAPGLMHSAEVGATVGQDQAIRERLRLYPQATVREIVAMFELDGLKVSAAAVKKAKDER
jgi:hypothetical protein